MVWCTLSVYYGITDMIMVSPISESGERIRNIGDTFLQIPQRQRVMSTAGRPPKPEAERITTGISVKMRRSELALVRLAASAAGLPVTTWARRVLVAQALSLLRSTPLPDDQRAEFAEQLDEYEQTRRVDDEQQS